MRTQYKSKVSIRDEGRKVHGRTRSVRERLEDLRRLDRLKAVQVKPSPSQKLATEPSVPTTIKVEDFKDLTLVRLCARKVAKDLRMYIEYIDFWKEFPGHLKELLLEEATFLSRRARCLPKTSVIAKARGRASGIITNEVLAVLSHYDLQKLVLDSAAVDDRVSSRLSWQALCHITLQVVEVLSPKLTSLQCSEWEAGLDNLNTPISRVEKGLARLRSLGKGYMPSL